MSEKHDDKKLSTEVQKRIDLVKTAEEPEELRKHLCPFFEKGGHPDCVVCRKTESDLDECRDYYLGRISLLPMEIWSEEFDKFLVQSREKVSMKEIVGIGINCDTCYMADKCPLFRKGFTCGIDWGENAPKTPAEFLEFLITTQFERVKRAAVFEKIDGGVPDANLSGELDRLSGFVAQKEEMGREKLSISMEASRPVEGGGILAKLFGSPAPAVEAPAKVIEAPVEEAEVVEDKTKEKVPVTVPR